MKPRVTIFSNQKGGVGKTTLCRELGVYVASQGLSVLLVDADPQGNLSRSLLTEPPESIGGLFDALEASIISIKELSEHLSILAGDFRLSALEKSLVGEIDAFGRLKELFESKHFRRFDHIFVDTPLPLACSLETLLRPAITFSSQCVLRSIPCRELMTS